MLGKCLLELQTMERAALHADRELREQKNEE